MLAPKAKSSMSEPSNHKEPAVQKEQPNHKATPSLPRVSKLTKAGSSKPERAPSPQQNARIPLDKSSSSVDTKPAGEHRPLKTTPRKQSRILKPSELQAQLTLVQADLKNAKEHLALIEKEKAQVLEDSTLAKRSADEALGKLEESLAAQKSAEEALELEKFRSLEWEQSSIESAQKKEEEWKRKLENIKKRHAEDVAALVSATKELAKVKDELARTVEAKNSAISQADEVEKIANANAKKAEILMADVSRQKALLGSELESKAKEAAEIIKKLESEASVLKAELGQAKAFEVKLAELERTVEGLKVDVAYAKRAEADANHAADEWKTKAESLQVRVDEVGRSNESNKESLASLTKSFEDCTSMLKDKQSEVAQLKAKAASLEHEVAEYKEGFLETNRRLDVAQQEASQLQAAIGRLKSEHEMLHDAHQEVVRNERTASSQIDVLSEDKNKQQRKLDKVKKAVEDLAAALREVSSEAREAKERVLAKQAELESAQSQVSELKAAMRNAEDRHQIVLGESAYETACLRKTVERLGSEAKSSKDAWRSKEAALASSLKSSEDEINAIKSDMNKLIQSLQRAENQVQELKEGKTQLQNKLKRAESRLSNASSTAEAANAETARLKDQLSDKEKELLSLRHEVTDLRLRETAASAKVRELSKSLTETTAKRADDEEAARSTEKSMLLLTKLELDKALESLSRAEDDKVQLQNKLRQVESKITEANLTAEEAKISGLRLEETLEDKEHELQITTRENDQLRAREAAALAKIDELSALHAEVATARKVEPNGAARSPEKSNTLLKFICSPMDNVRDDEPDTNDKHVEVETVEATHEQELSKITENDVSKETERDTDSAGDDTDSHMEESFRDQTNGLLNHGTTSTFSEPHSQKKKKALLKKFGNLLKKKAHFSKMTKHS